MHPITHAQTRPDHPAMIMAGSGQTVTFAEMDAYANRFAQLLRARGLKRGDHFAVLMENNVHYLQVVWGSQRAGTMMVPISTRLTAPEICYILKDAGAKFLLTSTRYAEAIEGIRDECADLPLLIVDGEGEEDYEAALAAQPAEPIADQAPGQYMLYSSGTTGRPKGVKPAPPEDDDILATNPLMGLAVMGAGMPADGSMVYLSPAPLYHAAPIGWCTTAQRLGGTVVVCTNRRLGVPRSLTLPGETDFLGAVRRGLAGDCEDVLWRGRRVVSRGIDFIDPGLTDIISSLSVLTLFTLFTSLIYR